MAQEEPTNYQFAGTGIGLQYIGDWCYAYSPAVGHSADSQNLFTWRTGAGVIVGLLRITGPIQYDDPSGARIQNSRVKFNGEVIALLHNDFQATDKFGETGLNLIIPPLTLVEVDFEGINTASDFKTTAVFTGRVYGVE